MATKTELMPYRAPVIDVSARPDRRTLKFLRQQADRQALVDGIDKVLGHGVKLLEVTTHNVALTLIASALLLSGMHKANIIHPIDAAGIWGIIAGMETWKLITPWGD